MSKELIPLMREFANLGDKLDKIRGKENFSWRKVKEVWDEVKEKSSISRSAEWQTKTAQMQKWGFLGEIAESCWEIAEAVAKGGKSDIPPEIYPSTSEELSFFQEIADEIPKMINWVESGQAGEVKNKETKTQEIKAKNEELKTFISQERKKLGHSSSSSVPINKPNPQEEKKIQEQEQEIGYLKKQLTELQNQMEELKQNQTTNQDSNPEISQKLESLQNKKQEIQSKLKTKQSQQKELKDKVEQQQNNNSGFNWLYVVIPGGVLLVIAGIVIAYLVGKNKKRE